MPVELGYGRDFNVAGVDEAGMALGGAVVAAAVIIPATISLRTG
jgi:ribonuclease HII